MHRSCRLRGTGGSGDNNTENLRVNEPENARGKLILSKATGIDEVFPRVLCTYYPRSLYVPPPGRYFIRSLVSSSVLLLIFPAAFTHTFPRVFLCLPFVAFWTFLRTFPPAFLLIPPTGLSRSLPCVLRILLRLFSWSALQRSSCIYLYIPSFFLAWIYLINQAGGPYWENIAPRSWQKSPRTDILPVRFRASLINKIFIHECKCLGKTSHDHGLKTHRKRPARNWRSQTRQGGQEN